MSTATTTPSTNGQTCSCGRPLHPTRHRCYVCKPGGRNPVHCRAALVKARAAKKAKADARKTATLRDAERANQVNGQPITLGPNDILDAAPVKRGRGRPRKVQPLTEYIADRIAAAAPAEKEHVYTLTVPPLDAELAAIDAILAAYADLPLSAMRRVRDYVSQRLAMDAQF